jgi:CheY-like chemotaxis protein
MTNTAPSPVLYVEDEENDVLLVQLGFKRGGINRPLKVATDGKGAVDYLSGTGSFSDRIKHPLPCLVMLDLNLPRLNGLEVLQWIRSQSQFKELPVVIFSSSGQPDDVERARELGANDYVVKPPNLTGVVEMVRTLQGRWLSVAM